MKKTTAKKPKEVKPKHCIVHLKFATTDELSHLDEIKKLTGSNVATKAVSEALLNYPKFLKKSDSLNTELQKAHRELESLTNKIDTVKRAFNIINGVEAKPKFEEDYDDGIDLTNDDECTVCGNDEFDDDGDCTECGNNKND